MIEIIQEYRKLLLWDGWLSFYRRGDYAAAVNFIGVVMGGLLAVILAVGRVCAQIHPRLPSGRLRIFFAATPPYALCHWRSIRDA